MTEIRLHFRDLEKLVFDTFGSEFDFLLAAGVTPGMFPMYIAEPKVPDVASFQATMDRLAAGRSVSRNAAVVINALVMKSALQAGLYVIDTKCRSSLLMQYVDILREDKDPNSHACRQFKAQYASESGLLSKLARIDKHVMECLE